MRASDPSPEPVNPDESGVLSRLNGEHYLTYAERTQLQTDYWAAEVARWRGVNHTEDLSWFRSPHEHRAMTAADLGLANG